jgi:hypothetical protein
VALSDKLVKVPVVAVDDAFIALHARPMLLSEAELPKRSSGVVVTARPKNASEATIRRRLGGDRAAVTKRQQPTHSRNQKDDQDIWLGGDTR